MDTTVDMDAVAVWDVHTPGHFASQHWQAADRWAKDHGLLSGGHTYRVEIYPADPPYARVFSYAANQDGQRYLDPATGNATLAEPVTVALGELPPRRLQRVI